MTRAITSCQYMDYGMWELRTSGTSPVVYWAKTDREDKLIRLVNHNSTEINLSGPTADRVRRAIRAYREESRKRELDAVARSRAARAARHNQGKTS